VSEWQIPDLRGGLIFTNNPKAQLGGQSWEDEDRVLWLTETEDFADEVKTHDLVPIWLTHGPRSVRILADYDRILKDHQIAILERSDAVGEQFARLAAGILQQVAIVRRVHYPRNTELRTWLGQFSKRNLKSMLQSTPLAPVESPWPEARPRIYKVLDACGARLLPDGRMALWPDLIADDLNELMLMEWDDWGLQEFVVLNDLPDDETYHDYLVRYAAQRRREESLEEYLKRVFA
jgi:hypothetical protein